jgi:hypothetical protein
MRLDNFEDRARRSKPKAKRAEGVNVSWIPVSDQPKLLTCPFCGHAAKAFVSPGSSNKYQIECRGPCMIHPNAFGRTLEEVASDWNRRSSANQEVSREK